MVLNTNAWLTDSLINQFNRNLMCIISVIKSFWKQQGIFNSLWLSDTIWRKELGQHWLISMAADKPKLNQCWRTFNTNFWYTPGAVSQEILTTFTTTMNITHLKFHPNLPRAYDLMNDHASNKTPVMISQNESMSKV